MKRQTYEMLTILFDEVLSEWRIEGEAGISEWEGTDDRGSKARRTLSKNIAKKKVEFLAVLQEEGIQEAVEFDPIALGM